MAEGSQRQGGRPVLHRLPRTRSFPPNYTIFGHVTSGLDTLVKIAKAGSTPTRRRRTEAGGGHRQRYGGRPSMPPANRHGEGSMTQPRAADADVWGRVDADGTVYVRTADG